MFTTGNPLGDHLIPSQPNGLASGVVSLSAGGWTSCAILSGGALKCWGMNASGQVGDGSELNAYSPTNVSGLSSGVRSVSVGPKTTCALMSSGTLKCWGSNGEGQTGIGSVSYSVVTPTTVNGVSGALETASGEEHTCALFELGMIRCWGNNEVGQLGNGTYNNSLSPVTVLNQ